MIQLDEARCSGCGLCARICHESCIEIISGIPRLELFGCSTCTQCIAVCPTQALSWDGSAPLRFERSNLPTFSQLEELFRERRSINVEELNRLQG